MSFHFDYPYSEQAFKFAAQYRDFLTRDTNIRVLDKYNDINKWAATFEEILKKNSEKAVEEVLRHYKKCVREANKYVYATPDELLASFPILRQQCRKRYNPLPESDFRVLVDEFEKCRWSCDREILVATLGQSLSALRRFNRVLSQSSLSQAKKDYIRNEMGSNFAYIRKKLLPPQPWVCGRTYRLPNPITTSSLCEEMNGLLRAYGYHSGVLDNISSSR